VFDYLFVPPGSIGTLPVVLANFVDWSEGICTILWFEQLFQALSQVYLCQDHAELVNQIEVVLSVFEDIFVCFFSMAVYQRFFAFCGQALFAPCFCLFRLWPLW